MGKAALNIWTRASGAMRVPGCAPVGPNTLRISVRCMWIAVLLLMPAFGDVLRLKTGPALQGVLVSANSREVAFLSMDGKVNTYPVTAVAGVDFAQLPAAAPRQPGTAAATLTLPVGTVVAVRTIDAIDEKTAKPGARFKASIADPLTVGANVAISRGADCTLEIVSVESGDQMALRLAAVSLNGKNYSVSTDYAEVEAEGTSKTKKTVRRGIGLGAVGAGIGALAGGGSGAAIGAAVGGGVGAISGLAAKGKQINVPSETRLLFSLKAPLIVLAPQG